MELTISKKGKTMEVNHRLLRSALVEAALIFPPDSKWEMEVERFLPRYDFLDLFGGFSYTLIAPTPERVMQYAQILREHSPCRRYPITNAFLRLRAMKQDFNNLHVVWGSGAGMVPQITLYDWLVEQGQNLRMLVNQDYMP